MMTRRCEEPLSGEVQKYQSQNPALTSRHSTANSLRSNNLKSPYSSDQDHGQYRSSQTAFQSPAVGKQVIAAVTPSPRSNGSAYEGQLVTIAMPSMYDGNGAWRKHGKLFRANIVLADESNGGNSFALSDSCNIERYYRVADRVLEQFLSVNISERNALIESYLIGNRLFKFLSVVLPTHHQYFSRDPKFEELRNRSESQLMELLEYMEELEIMIDEMEYNRFIFKDPTPSELNDIRSGNEASFIINDPLCNDDREIHGQLLEGLTKNYRNHDEKSTDAFIDEANMKIPIQTNHRKGTLRQNQHLQVGVEGHSSQGDINGGKFQDVKVAVGEIEALYESEGQPKCTKNNLESKHKLLKERVAAVVTSRNNLELLRTSLPSIRSAPMRGVRSTSSSPASTDGKRLDVLPETTSTEVNPKIKGIIPEGDDSIDNKGHSKGMLSRLDFSKATKIPEKQQPCAWDTIIQDSLPEDSFTSWDADFSNFHSFTPERNQFEFLDEKKTHIDLLLDNPVLTNGISKKESKLLPKIRDPPVSNAHNIRAHTQCQAATFSSSFRHTDMKMNMFEFETSPALSDCSSDIFYSLEDRGPFEISSVKTKIEERMELAMVLKGDTPGRRSMSLNTAHYEDSSQMEAQSQRKVLHQFRGCVKYFLE